MCVLQSDADVNKEFVLAPHKENINRLFNAPTVEEIFSQLEADGSEWAMKQLATLKKMVSKRTVRVPIHTQ